MATRIPGPTGQTPLPGSTAVGDQSAPRGAAPTQAEGLALPPPPSTTRDRLPPMSTDGVAPRQGLSQVAARGFDPALGAKLFAFDPAAAPNSVGFIDVLRQVGRSPQAAQAVKGLVGGIEQTVGLRLPPEVTQAALHKPELLAGLMVLTPQQMKAGFDALHRTPARNLMDAAVKTRHLPKTFDLGKLDRTQIPLPPERELTELAPGLYRGGVRNPKLSDAQAKQRIVLAEVMDRLADNANLPAGERFAVKFGGGEYTRLSTFLEAMQDAGYRIDARVDHRVANFLGLEADTPDGLKSVASPVMVNTGITDAAGEPAIIPAVHSEIVFSITAGPDVKGEPIEGEVKWYQGVPHTGFFASGLQKQGDWVGTRTTSRYEGAEALTAAKYAGLMSDVINDAAQKAERPMAGYGDTGVCIDSVATIVNLMKDDVTAFPLLQGDELLLKELDQRVAHGNPQDAPEYRALAGAVKAIPSDAAGAPAAGPGLLGARERARLSLPWTDGPAPLLVARRAEQILGG